MSHDVFSVLCDPDTCVSSFIHYSEFGSLSVQDFNSSLHRIHFYALVHVHRLLSCLTLLKEFSLDHKFRRKDFYILSNESKKE